MKVVEIGIDKIKPYEKNPRRNDSAVDAVANSIRQFGFQQPLVLDTENVIIVGHTRYRAAQKLGLKSVPCVIADNLSEQAVNAYRIADNSVGELAEWDDDLLRGELEEIFDFNMKDFGVDLPDLDFDDPVDYKEKTDHMKCNIMNLDKAHYDGVGDMDIPQLEPVYELPEIKEWIGFNYVLTDKNPEGKGVHFFMDDYQFERIWNQPERYIEKLRKYVAVATPDFSPYGDMPLCLQIFNHYRKHWVGKILQMNGIIVIPTIRCSSDPRFLRYFLDGEPVGGIVMMSSMWTGEKSMIEADETEYRMVLERLKPKKILMYGGKTSGMAKIIADDDPVEFIPSFAQQRLHGRGVANG